MALHLRAIIYLHRSQARVLLTLWLIRVRRFHELSCVKKYRSPISHEKRLNRPIDGTGNAPRCKERDDEGLLMEEDKLSYKS